MTDLWKGLGTAVARLERIAESPDEWDDPAVRDELPSHQYALHAGAELALGIVPPRGLEEAHAELVAALGQARDSTAEISQAVQAVGPELVEPLLPEWRGALFRVRLARLRALERHDQRVGSRGEGAPAPSRLAAGDDGPVPFNRSGLAHLAASALVLGGGILFAAGAVLAAWPLWAAGLMLAAGGFLLVRP